MMIQIFSPGCIGVVNSKKKLKKINPAKGRHGLLIFRIN